MKSINICHAEHVNKLFTKDYMTNPSNTMRVVSTRISEEMTAYLAQSLRDNESSASFIATAIENEIQRRKMTSMPKNVTNANLLEKQEKIHSDVFETNRRLELVEAQLNLLMKSLAIKA